MKTLTLFSYANTFKGVIHDSPEKSFKEPKIVDRYEHARISSVYSWFKKNHMKDVDGVYDHHNKGVLADLGEEISFWNLAIANMVGRLRVKEYA